MVIAWEKRSQTSRPLRTSGGIRMRKYLSLFTGTTLPRTEVQMNSKPVHCHDIFEVSSPGRSTKSASISSPSRPMRRTHRRIAKS